MLETKLLSKTNWRKVKLGEVGRIVTGKTPSTKKPENFGGPFPFITIPDLKNQRYILKTERTISKIGAQKMKNLRLPINSVVMSCLATVGETGITTKESFTNQQINSVICYPEVVDYRFLYYLFRRLKRKLLKYSGSVYTNISKSKFFDIEVELPLLNNQQRIASILSAFDYKIELNNKISKNLEQTARAIFKEWFVKFKFPGYEKVKMVDSELGKIPEGWKIGNFKDLLKVKHGFAFPSDKFKTKGIPVIKIKNILENNKINLKEVDFIELEDFKNLENFKLRNGDVLIAMTGATSGKIGILVGEYSDYFLNQRVGKCKFLKFENKWFSFIYLTQSNVRSMLLGLSDGSAQGNLSPSRIENLEVIIPELKILQKFNDIANGWFLKIQKIDVENQKLAALRDLLLPKLMSGDINVAS